MTKYALFVERVKSGVQRQITVSCAIVGDPSDHFGTSKTFETDGDLLTALATARIADVEINTAIQTVKSGFSGFAYITYDNARSFGLLEDLPASS
jgi:hypothetical protein